MDIAQKVRARAKASPGRRRAPRVGTMDKNHLDP
jgi:hypothetical protein